VTAPRLAWGLCAAFAALCAAAIALTVADPGGGDEWLMVLLSGYAVSGAMVAARQPRNAVGWILLAVAIAFGVQGVGELYVAMPDWPAREYVGWVAAWSWYVWMALIGVFLPLVFPTGRPLSPRWRVVAWLGGAALALSVAGEAFGSGELDLSAPVPNPFALHGIAGDAVAVAAVLGDVLVAVAFVLAGVSVVLRFRRARGVERAQLKWFALIGLLCVVALAMAMLAVLFPGGWRDPIGDMGWYSFLLLGLIGIPFATGIAILRHRLYDIDVVIRRTLVYAALTATLGATYLAFVLLSGLAFGDSDLAIAAGTLAAAALFRPALARIQAAVDRRFYRRRYDAALTLEAFGARLRDEVDLDALGADLRGVVAETVQPAHVSLWLRGVR
jgi:hypothetical protein